MNYKQFLDYIYQRHSGNVKLGLERMINILEEMGNPNLKMQGFHVAGTNGKGSTSAMLESLCRVYDLSTGLNTSPHLVDYRERIRVNKNDIKLEQLIDLYKKWKDVFEKNEASFFEITTAMAFAHFYEKKVDTAIFEVGLGGRLDGTNPFKSSVGIITSVSYDHTKSLGSELSQIAYEKAGIIKENTPFVIGKMDSVPREVILKIAKERNAPVLLFDRDFKVDNVHTDAEGTHFDYISNELTIKGINTNLIGIHQAYNASLAITAFIIYLNQRGFEVKENLIRSALKNVIWQGRMQMIGRNPYTFLDGAHNEEGVDSLVKTLIQLFPNKKIIAVIAILRDKNLEKIIENICSIAHKIYIAKNQSTRAAELTEQAEFVEKAGGNYQIIENVVDAFVQARKDANEDDVIIISGSLYTISEILKEKETLNLI